LALEHVGISLDAAARLGKRTAELHLALATATTDPAFAPEPLSAGDVQALRASLRQRATGAFDALRDSVARLPDEIVDLAGMVLGRRKQIIDTIRLPLVNGMRAQRIRTHGDYHLGNVLRVRTNYVILNFAGETGRPLEERRAKKSPLQDVAGMLRSLSYAAYASLINYSSRRPEDFEKLEPWARLWERSVTAEFLHAYRETASGAGFLPAEEAGFRELLTAYWLDRVLYELTSELNNRPAWARIPLAGLLSLPLDSGRR